MDHETQVLVDDAPEDPLGKLPEAYEPSTPPAATSDSVFLEPVQWIQMLCRELNPSFVFGVMVVYGLSQGFAGSFFRVVSDYYWKDVQKVQPSLVQIFIGLYYIPWIMKPVWGVLTDVVPVYGYHRRPYFVAAGILAIASTFIVATFAKLPVIIALLCLIGMTAAVAIADVTIDACIARNSIDKPALAADMQTLCQFVAAFFALVGFLASGVIVHSLGAQGAMSIMAIPAIFLIFLGFIIHEDRSNQPSKKRNVLEKANEAIRGMVKTIKYPMVWKPSLYMYLSLALSISTHEGQFYWYTDPKAGPAFSQEFIGISYAIGATGSMIGVLIYHKLLKNYPFRSLAFYAQLLYALSGMLDLIFVLRWNLKLHIPDAVFIILEECCSRIISKIRWMPMIVLSTKLCPLGIEGTFFALLMCIDSLGSLSSKTAGGITLHLLHVTRTNFKNLWLVVLIRNLLRIATLGFIFLVPNSDPSEVLLPPDLVNSSSSSDENLQLANLNADGFHRLNKAPPGLDES